ncbi:hypothetical protein K505DRAFT_232887 [Melanomma pulvis-pyrius CBS 109.77]|uniref:Zn(2)-C6 fungal-type domain-containing protein n=1 Tax=Melanomma pulvis-pyrius CBS 109.77 TaxID=1314802 RepID=A0A6A6XPX5_9PLEO|nr:hypothetical protein K505DRAFT_232887 [Melanomma pulvis-pyrius CBS 109.77]
MVGLSDNAVQPPSRSGPRSRRGCWTCRSPQVKKRCDERRPTCGRCTRLSLHCDYSLRPTLAQRRRKEIAAHAQEGSSLTIVRLAATSTGVCSLTLSNTDHEAIRFFRTAFAKFHHTKNPDYSLFSIMFDIAQEDPMVMHMVISLGILEMDHRRPNKESKQEQNSRRHYTSALGFMRDAVSPRNESQDIDAIYTALWLMLLYEQQFGDAGCKAYANHLTGAASLLQDRGQRLLQLPSSTAGSLEKAPVLLRRSHGQDGSKLSVYSARIIVWISLLDAAAASSGIGGQVNGALFSILLNSGGSNKYATPVEAFSRLHRYSNPLYRLAWGDLYPQPELLDDVENRNIYALLGQCGQLRFMVAQLAVLYRKDAAAAALKARDVDVSIEQVGYFFTELMEVASDLSLDTDNSHRLVANIRAIVPMYHAVVLDFMRVSAFDQPLGDRQRHALREILNMAYQSFKHDGDEAIIRVAWPLFMAALETDDLLHRDWVLDRFAAIGKYGKNFERAHRFLKEMIPAQQNLGRRIELRARLERTEQFVLA